MRLTFLCSLVSLGITSHAAAADPAPPPAAGPWLLFDHTLVLAQAPDETWFDGGPTRKEVFRDYLIGERVFRKVHEDKLPPALLGLRGQSVTLYRFGSPKPVCRATVEALSGRGLLKLHPSGTWAPLGWREGEPIMPPAAEIPALVWKDGRGFLAGVLKPVAKGNCMGADFAVAGDGASPASLKAKKERPKSDLVKAALATFRAHGFWEAMQGLYKKDGFEGSWDQPPDWDPPRVQGWYDGATLRYVTVSVWGGLCTPAQGWMLLQPTDPAAGGDPLEVVAFAGGAEPTAIMDFGADGQWEIAISNAFQRIVFRAPMSADQPIVLYSHGEPIGVIECGRGG